MSSNGDIPPRAVEWIHAVLRDEAPPAPYYYLGRLKVYQLKLICSALKARTLQIHNISLVSSATRGQIVVFVPPKSYAKKAEFVLAISTYFNTHGTSNNNFYDLLNGRTNVLAGASSTTSSVPSVVNVPSHLVASTFPTTNPPVAQAVRTSLSNVSTNTPSAAVGAKKLSPTKRSPLKKTNTSSLPTATAGHGPTCPTALYTTATTADAMHRSFHDQLHQNSISHLPHQSTLHAASAMSVITSVPTTGGVKRATTSLSPIKSAGPIHPPSKVKKQSLTNTSTTQSKQSFTHVRPATASSTEDDSDKPRDFRENSMLASLRQMGFANTVEILTALRAVAAQRAEENRVGCTEWTQHEQVDAAMTWIVTQREEAEFARALDAARILSEQENAIQEQSRKQRMAQELKHANMIDLLGSTNGEGLDTRSTHFPHSVLLRNRSVRSVLKSVASGSSIGKTQVIRLLNLELKARKWYGTVLPFSYFEYVLCPSFGSGAGLNATALRQKVQQVSDDLEHAMYNLSEQVEGGIGSVPKVFFDAQAKAAREGMPISAPEDAEVIIDDDVEVVEKSLPSSSSACACGSETHRSEVGVMNIA